MNLRRASLIALSSVAVFIASASSSHLQAAKPLILKYSAEEGLGGHQAKGATFKAWIDEGRPVVATTDEKGRVVLELGRALAKGQTLFVEAESAEGDRFFSWVYRDSELSGNVRSTCRLVGIRDFRHPDIVTAQRIEQ